MFNIPSNGCQKSFQLLALILFIKATTTFLTLVFVDPISPLNDARYFLKWSLVTLDTSSWSFGLYREAAVGIIAGYLKHLSTPDYIVHLFFSFMSGTAIWWLFRDRDLYGWRLFVLILLLLSPAVAIWGSTVSKEALSIVFSCLFFRALLDTYEKREMRGWATLILFLLLFALMRAHYAIGLFWLMVTMGCALIFSKRVSARPAIMVLCLSSLGAIILFWNPFWGVLENWVMPEARRYFLTHTSAHLNRPWVEFYTRWDFLKNLWWGMPFSIIGPLPSEMSGHPGLALLFASGIMTITLYGICIVAAGRRLISDNFGSIFFWCGVVPAALITCLAHYPFGILNAGSAIRYHTPISVQLGFSMLAFSAIKRSSGVFKAAVVRHG